MSFITTHYCDGCGVKISATEVQKSVESGQAFVQQNPAVLQGALFDVPVRIGPVTEVLCDVCLKSAHEFWGSKVEAMQELVKEMNKRYSRNRQSFFESRKSKLKAV
jgi:hypothetical protein